MTLDSRFRAATTETVKELGQDVELANRLNAWIEEVINGNEDFDDVGVLERHLTNLYSAVNLGSVHTEKDS